jgi:hypothetical protein
MTQSSQNIFLNKCVEPLVFRFTIILTAIFRACYATRLYGSWAPTGRGFRPRSCPSLTERG